MTIEAFLSINVPNVNFTWVDLPSSSSYPCSCAKIYANSSNRNLVLSLFGISLPFLNDLEGRSQFGKKTRAPSQKR